MKIVLTQDEFETAMAAWVYENLVKKSMASAKILDEYVELEVFGEGAKPATSNGADEPEMPYEFCNK